MIDMAKADLAARTGIDPQRIRVVEAREVEWPDTSLGCPEPGKLYAQVITPGYLIVFTDGQRRYEYHTDRSNRVVLCKQTP